MQTQHGLPGIRGRNVSIDGRRIMLSPTSVAVLRLLADAGGAVVSKAALREALSESRDDHALDVAVGRLRKALNQPGMIATVTKRGHRLNI